MLGDAVWWVFFSVAAVAAKGEGLAVWWGRVPQVKPRGDCQLV